MGNTYIYEQYFGLREHPFSITPDPRFIYLSDIHRTALEHLESGATGGVNGFVLLTGDVGAGKTTICRTFLEKLPPRTEVALILNPVLTLNEFLQAICDELDLVIEGSRTSNKNLIDQLNRFLLQVYAVGQKTILIVDEAQNLSQELLEQIRLLTNLETATDKLLQIFLIGQPGLRDMLSRPEMVQVSQRITSRYHLGPLSKEDTRKYIMRRLEVAGAPDLEFTSSGVQRIYAFSKGVPRVINVLCDKALISAYENHTSKIDAKIVKEAEGRVVGNLPTPAKDAGGSRVAKVVGLSLVGALVLLIGAYWADVGGLRPWADDRLGIGDPATAAVNPPVAPAQKTDAETQVLDRSADSATVNGGLAMLPAAEPGPGADAQDEVSAEDSRAETISPPSVVTPPGVAMIEPPSEPVVEPPEVESTVVAPEPGSTAPVETSMAPLSTSPSAAAVSPAPPISVSPSPKTPPAVERPAVSPQVLAKRPAPVGAQTSATPQQSLADYTRSYAERKLLSMWGVTGTETVGLDFCQTAERQGLTCLGERAGLPGLYLYDRPAIINLTIDNVSSYAVVLKASAANVVLDVLDQEHVIPADSLREVWDGNFLLLWQRPQSVGNYLREGATGPSALWLRRALDRIEGTATSGNSYDAQMAARVRRFQREVGLTPDGIIGPRTFILLQNALAESRG